MLCSSKGGVDLSIHLFEPEFNKKECIGQISECLDKGWTGLGYKTVEFEEAWKKYTGFENALFLNSCTSALILAVDGLKTKYGWESECEIITTPNTFVSTNHAILKNGLKPVFADIDDTFCLNPESVEKKITKNTCAIIFVGIGGNASNYKAIVKLCEKYKLKLILDAAHMAGTKINGQIVGDEADAVCYSFHAVKNLCTADSGMLCFADGNLDAEARKKSWLGIDKNTYERTKVNGYSWEYDIHYLGEKYNGNSIMAAIAVAQLPQLEKGNRRRKEIADIYTRYFSKYKDSIKLVRIDDNCDSSFHLYQILVENRDGLIDYLRSRNIDCGVHYISNTRYQLYSYATKTCPFAEYVSDHVVSLPMHLRLKDEEVTYVALSVIDYISE